VRTLVREKGKRFALDPLLWGQKNRPFAPYCVLNGTNAGTAKASAHALLD
jgi:hypothetical protein